MINLIYTGSADGLASPWGNYKQDIDFVLSCDPLHSKMSKRKNKLAGKHFQTAIFDKEEVKTFYVLKKKKCSSLFPPDYEFIKEKFGDIPRKYATVDKIEIACCRLDSLIEQSESIAGKSIDFDFLFSDVQGADFNVVRSMGDRIGELIGLHLELYLKPFYKGAVLFEEADKFFKEQGFTLVKNFRKNPDVFDNFLYIRENTAKKDKLNFIKRVYKI
jgi:hypothetical protein